MSSPAGDSMAADALPGRDSQDPRVRPTHLPFHLPEIGDEEIRGVAAAMTPRTKAIVPVHHGGLPCDMERVRAIARAHGAVVVEDAAHALPATRDGAAVGTLGDMACFSFYATKTITTGEGGMVTT